MSSLGRRLAQHAAFRRRRLTLRSRSWVFGGHDLSRAVWICSWQRSGSTWLAELLASPPRTRLVYEPANLPDNCFEGVEASLTPLPSESMDHIEAVVRGLAGHVHHWWTDQFNRTHFPRRLVAKDVRGLGVAGAVAARLPSTPVVLLVRNPLDVAASVLRLGWFDSELSPREAYLREVSTWCQLHETALSDPRLKRAVWVSYEALLEAPKVELDRVRAVLAQSSTTWLALDVDSLKTEERSQTDFATERGTSVESAWIEEARAVLAASPFGTYYDAPRHHVGSLQALLDSRGQ